MFTTIDHSILSRWLKLHSYRVLKGRNKISRWFQPPGWGRLHFSKARRDGIDPRFCKSQRLCRPFGTQGIYINHFRWLKPLDQIRIYQRVPKGRKKSGGSLYPKIMSSRWGWGLVPKGRNKISRWFQPPGWGRCIFPSPEGTA
jgi:hypothetical protein